MIYHLLLIKELQVLVEELNLTFVKREEIILDHHNIIKLVYLIKIKLNKKEKHLELVETDYLKKRLDFSQDLLIIKFLLNS